METQKQVEATVSTFFIAIKCLAKDIDTVKHRLQHIHDLILDTNFRIDELEREYSLEPPEPADNMHRGTSHDH